ncbi:MULTISPECIES: hypothetical protein [Asticcacaulis]|uniref:hypothetical protein n=1 Tax=Asticcacaulis TaxID=76890 RepID=UPI001AE4C081|nr:MULTISPECIES: hypothetical protein [Asticcacaulis]MBP2160454.1 hypothetical protein [Asticcacaulis solisilvae]MDR6801499.1 hypothetical protein [Asticcacaulis sp. BE141]
MIPPHSLPVIASTCGRYDMYGFIHKALRKAQCDIVVRLGQAGTDITPGLLTDLRDLLDLGRLHISHEEAHIHMAAELRMPQASSRLKGQHDTHRDTFLGLEGLIVAFEQAPSSLRQDAARRLYLAFSAFMARDFEHMLEEETAHNDTLWRQFSDAELMNIEGGIIASLAPEKVIRFMRLMVPAISRHERVTLLGGMKVNAPPEAFTAVMELAVYPTLSVEDLRDLEKRLSNVAAAA